MSVKELTVYELLPSEYVDPLNVEQLFALSSLCSTEYCQAELPYLNELSFDRAEGKGHGNGNDLGKIEAPVAEKEVYRVSPNRNVLDKLQINTIFTHSFLPQSSSMS
jgi:hypothetical protein